VYSPFHNIITQGSLKRGGYILFLIKISPDAVHNIGLRLGQLFSIVSDVSLDKEIPLLLPTLYRNLR